MPIYNEELVKQVYQPPFKANKVRAFAFIVKGDASKIRTNVVVPTLGPGFQTVPAGAFGIDDLFVVAWLRYDGGFTSDPPQNVLGGQHNGDYYKGKFAYSESAVFHIVESIQTRRAYIYIPSLFLDKSVPILTGRSVYGMPKTVGTLKIPTSQGVCSTYAEVIRKFQDPATASPLTQTPSPEYSLIYQAWPTFPFYWMLPKETVPVIRGDPLATVAAAKQKFAATVRRNADRSGIPQIADAVLELFGMFCLWGGGNLQPRTIFLKQLPSSSMSGQASFSTYVVSDFATTNISTISNFVPFPWFWRVQFMDWDGAPFARSFGVPTAPMIPLMAFSLVFDLAMPLGTELSNP